MSEPGKASHVCNVAVEGEFKCCTTIVQYKLVTTFDGFLLYGAVNNGLLSVPTIGWLPRTHPPGYPLLNAKHRPH